MELYYLHFKIKKSLKTENEFKKWEIHQNQTFSVKSFGFGNLALAPEILPIKPAESLAENLPLQYNLSC